MPTTPPAAHFLAVIFAKFSLLTKQALAALLCTPQHEALLDARYDTDAGHEVPPQRPQAPADDEEGEATAPQKDTAHPSKNKTFDIMEAQKDLVEAVVTMDLLPRIRYLVEVRGRKRRMLPLSLSRPETRCYAAYPSPSLLGGRAERRLPGGSRHAHPCGPPRRQQVCL